MTIQSPDESLAERTVAGLHTYVFSEVIEPLTRSAALDLGAGSGAFAQRLASAGFDVQAADCDAKVFGAAVPFQRVDLNSEASMAALGPGKWPLVTAIEVIEHLEAPIAFLRNLASLLTPGGIAIVTTPNVDSIPARVKLLIKDRIRMLDQHGDPTHISPIFWDLLVRQYLPRAGLRLVSSAVYPPDGFIAGRPVYRRLLGVARPVLRSGSRLLGDNHVLVLARQ